MQHTVIYRGKINTRHINDVDGHIVMTYYTAPKGPNLRIALIARSDEGEVLMTMSTNIPEWDVSEDTVIIKDYSENEGTLTFLVQQGIVKHVASVQYGSFVKMHVCTLLKKEHVE